MTIAPLLAAVLLLGAVRPAAAQVMSGPQGSAGGLFGGHRPADPNRTSQRLWLNVDLSGGYDSNAEGAAGTSPGELVPLYASTAEGVVRYWRGKTNRFVEVSGRSFVNYESTARDELIGGELLVMGSSNLVHRLQLTGGALATLDPTFLAGQFGAGMGESEPGLAPPRTNPQGLVEQRWLAKQGYVTLAQTWSARQSTNVDFRASHRRPFESEGLVSESQEMSLQHAWNFRRNAGLRLTYRQDRNLQIFETFSAPALRTSTFDIGVHVERRSTPLRTLSVDLSGGAAVARRDRLDGAGTSDFTLPVAAAAVRMGLTRVWSFAMEGTREISVLEGITVESFETTGGTVRLDAAFSRRVVLGLSGIYSSGRAMETRAGAFETASIRGQLQYGFGRCCGVFSSYSFYNHQLHDISRLPQGLPPVYNGHSIRLGFTWWLPLYGTF